jgi:hypothetical protein
MVDSGSGRANEIWLETIEVYGRRKKNISFLYSATTIRLQLKPLLQQQHSGILIPLTCIQFGLFGQMFDNTLKGAGWDRTKPFTPYKLIEKLLNNVPR